MFVSLPTACAKFNCNFEEHFSSNYISYAFNRISFHVSYFLSRRINVICRFYNIKANVIEKIYFGLQCLYLNYTCVTHYRILSKHV
jgi:hypothetical protein